MNDNTRSLSSQITDAHPWMKSQTAHALIAYKTAQLMETDAYGLISFKLDEYVSLIKNSDEHHVRDQVSIVQEWYIPPSSN